MADYWISVSEGVVGNVLTVLVLILAGRIWIGRRYRKLLHFFGLSDGRHLAVFTSTLRVRPGGSEGSDGIPRSYKGPAVPLNEVALWSNLAILFEEQVANTSSLPKPFNSLFVKRASVDHATSLNANMPSDASVVTIGSGAYNDISKVIETRRERLAWFDADGTAMKFADGSSDSTASRGFIQRLELGGGQVVFYVAGLSTLGTTAACYHLIRNWAALSRQARGKKSFCWFVETDGLSVERTSVIKTITA